MTVVADQEDLRHDTVAGKGNALLLIAETGYEVTRWHIRERPGVFSATSCATCDSNNKVWNPAIPK